MSNKDSHYNRCRIMDTILKLSKEIGTKQGDHKAYYTGDEHLTDIEINSKREFMQALEKTVGWR